MITFIEYLSNSSQEKEYSIPFDSREAFNKFLRSLRNETRSPISIINRDGKLVVSAPKIIHDRIKMTWKKD